LLSISDTLSTPNAAAKYQQSTKKLVISRIAILKPVFLGGRYQVKAFLDPSLPSDRAAWLERFNFNGLARLK